MEKDIRIIDEVPRISLNYSDTRLQDFKKKIWRHYAEQGRKMPWRENVSPYNVFVSEIMLQQTQVSRVEKFFGNFCLRYPDFASLADSPLDELLLLWKGMGYNRRAVFMRSAAIRIMNNYGGILPNNPELLVQLPGIGPNTAGSIVAFAYQVPTVFIETNIRRVYIHEFFPRCESVHDKEIYPLIEATIHKSDPRTWYWAVMDYGVSLKEQGRWAARRSQHYTRQSKFEGSARQLRAEILNEIALNSRAGNKGVYVHELYLHMKKALPKHPFDQSLLHTTLKQLEKEELLRSEEIAEGEVLYKLQG